LAAVNRVRRQWVAAANPAAPQLASGAANHGMGLPHHTVHRVSGLPAGGLYSIGPRSLLDHHDGASSGLVRTSRGALPPGKLPANGQSVWTEVRQPVPFMMGSAPARLHHPSWMTPLQVVASSGIVPAHCPKTCPGVRCQGWLTACTDSWLCRG